MDWSQFNRGVFLVNVLAVVYNKDSKKVLIGKRQNDPFIKNLEWSLPGGRPAYEENLEFYLKHEIKIKTGLEVDVKKVFHSRTIPEHREFLNIYYYCEVAGGEPKAGEKFVEIKWVNPSEVKDHFKSPPPDPKLLEFLKTLK